MNTPKIKKDREIFQFLTVNLSNKYNIDYKRYSIPCECLELKVDFIISLKDEFLQDKDRVILYYIQNLQNASMKKIVQSYDLVLSFSCTSIIWDNEDIDEKLVPLVAMLNDIVKEKTMNDILPQQLKFLIYCDTQETIELDRYTEEISYFNDSLIGLEKSHGLEEEVEEEHFDEDDGDEV